MKRHFAGKTLQIQFRLHIITIAIHAESLTAFLLRTVANIDSKSIYLRDFSHMVMAEAECELSHYEFHIIEFARCPNNCDFNVSLLDSLFRHEM